MLDAGIDDEIPGIEENLESGRLLAAGLATIDWSTGRTIFWVQGRGIESWRRPQRSGVQTRLSVDHVMASAALPLLFPAVKLAGSWHGDGGVRLTTPLAPAIHLGARRILAVSTRYDRSAAEAATPQILGYPPPAQIGGILLHSIFLDQLDHDAYQLERTNRLLASSRGRAIARGSAISTCWSCARRSTSASWRPSTRRRCRAGSDSSRAGWARARPATPTS